MHRLSSSCIAFFASYWLIEEREKTGSPINLCGIIHLHFFFNPSVIFFPVLKTNFHPLFIFTLFKFIMLLLLLLMCCSDFCVAAKCLFFQTGAVMILKDKHYFQDLGGGPGRRGW